MDFSLTSVTFFFKAFANVKVPVHAYYIDSVVQNTVMLILQLSHVYVIRAA